MKNTKRQEKGITLIALVITIIVLLILAGVAIAMLNGQNGVLNRATESKVANTLGSFKEQASMAQLSAKTSIAANSASQSGYIATYNGTGADAKNHFTKLAQEVANGLGVTAKAGGTTGQTINTEGYTVAYYLDTEGNTSTDGKGYIVIWYTNNGLRASMGDRSNALTTYKLTDTEPTNTSVNQAVLVTVIEVNNYDCSLATNVGLTSTTDGGTDIGESTFEGTSLKGDFDNKKCRREGFNYGDYKKIKEIFSYNNTIHNHDQDFKIAKNISLKSGFKLNNLIIDNNGTKLSTKESLFGIIYSKLGFHKEFNNALKFLSKPKFAISGSGGELLRGSPGHPIKKYIEIISRGYNKKFYNSSVRICKRSIALLKKKKTYYDDYEISVDLYAKGRARHHFGKSSVIAFLVNSYSLQPLIDPDIRQIKFDINEKKGHDLIAYIFLRFAHYLIDFPFEGKRELIPESIIKAENLNRNFPPYKIKSDYNKNFYIDIKRKSPVQPSSKNKNVEEYLNELFKSSKFIHRINKLYDNTVYNWAIEYIKKSNFFPLRHGYGLFAIAKILEDLSLNERYFNINNGSSLSEEKLIK